MIGERIKEIREKNGLTQSALAKKLNISRSAVNAWEMGISIPSAKYLIDLSKLLNVSTDYLLNLSKSEVIDISDLDNEEKKIIYSLLSYFKKYGYTMRNIRNQIEKEDTKNKTDKIIKNIVEEITSIKDLS